jgi:cell division protein FtsB
LEARYRRLSRLLTAALVVTATAGLGSLAWTADGLRDRVKEQDAQRRDAVTVLCEAQNAQNAKIVRFRKATDPESAKLARETFIQTDCRAKIRRLVGP